jgi:hypothetical protein
LHLEEGLAGRWVSKVVMVTMLMIRVMVMMVIMMMEVAMDL